MPRQRRDLFKGTQLGRYGCPDALGTAQYLHCDLCEWMIGWVEAECARVAVRRRGTIVTAFIVCYALTSFIAGYVSGGFYSRNDGESGAGQGDGMMGHSHAHP